MKSFEYGYDSLNRRTSEDEDSGGADGYAYDAADQLTAVNYQDGRTVHYAYDGAGNRTQVVDSSSGTVPYAARQRAQPIFDVRRQRCCDL